MVSEANTFLIDATFILSKTSEAFHKTPLLVSDRKDLTFIYGFLRDMLRLRLAVGVERGILVFGSEGHGVATDADVGALVEFVHSLGLPVVHDTKRSVLDLCYHLSKIATHLVTNDMKLIQLATERLGIIIPNVSNQYEYLTTKDVPSRIGVSPAEISTFVALHHSEHIHKKAGPFTKRVAIRLIELYGKLEDIYANLDSIKAAGIRDRLAANSETLLHTYEVSKVNLSPIHLTLDLNQIDWRINNERVVQLLSAHRLHSLARLLPIPDDLPAIAHLRVRESNAYMVVQDEDSLRELESTVCGSQVCAVDTESDDRDPRKADLFGVAFSVQKGAATFVPLLERDLKTMPRGDVIASLHRMLTSKHVKFVGHNMKYDALLLRRHGFAIQNFYFDTMLAAYDCFGDWDFFNLGFLTEKLLGKRIRRYREIVPSDETFFDLPLREMKDHGCEDADFALRLYRTLDMELNRRDIREQYHNATMELARRLTGYEFHGVGVDVRKLERARGHLLTMIDLSKKEAWGRLGKKLDLDSGSEIASSFKDHPSLGAGNSERPVSLRLLEELAIQRPDIIPIVTYRRLRKELKRLESIASSAKEGRVYPLFNQVRLASGRLCSSEPDLFDVDGLNSVKPCVCATLGEFFPDCQKALDCLVVESGDENLKSDRSGDRGNNRYMAKHATMKRLNHQDFLLTILCGESGPVLSRRFSLDRMEVESACHDLNVRYYRLF